MEKGKKKQREGKNKRRKNNWQRKDRTKGGRKKVNNDEINEIKEKREKKNNGEKIGKTEAWTIGRKERRDKERKDREKKIRSTEARKERRNEIGTDNNRKNEGARGVMVIAVGNGHGDTSSNPGQDWCYFI